MAEERKWQNKAEELLINKKKLLVEACTGSGKTFFTIKALKLLLKEKPKQSILIAVPTIILLEQWFLELKHNGLFSDKVGLFYGEVKEFAQITITTISSLEKVSDLLWSQFNVIIFDEVHNMYSPKRLRLLDMPAEYKIGLSASIFNEKGKHWKILEKFEYNLYTYDLKEAIKDNIVNRFIFHHIGVVIDDEKTERELEHISSEIGIIIRAAGGYHSYMQLPDSNEAKLKAYKLIKQRETIVYSHPNKLKQLVAICRQNRNKKIIIFNESNSVGQKIYFELLGEGFNCKVINSDVSKQKRVEYISQYQHSKFNILITTRMFDEGYNLPSIDVPIIFSGNSTKKQAIQRVGRGLRKKDVISHVYQIYVKHTFEEPYAEKRKELFSDLAEEVCTV